MALSKLTLDEFINTYTREHNLREVPKDRMFNLVRQAGNLLSQQREKNPSLPQACVAGGFLRDTILGTIPKDFDIFVLNSGGDDSADNVLRYLPDHCEFWDRGDKPEGEGSSAFSSCPETGEAREPFYVANTTNFYNFDDFGEKAYHIGTQVIGRPQATIEDLLADFDYGLVQIAYDPADGSITMNREVWDDFLKTGRYVFPTEQSYTRALSFRQWVTTPAYPRFKMVPYGKVIEVDQKQSFKGTFTYLGNPNDEKKPKVNHPTSSTSPSIWKTASWMPIKKVNY